MQRKRRDLESDVRRLLAILRIEMLRLRAAARSARTITTDRPEPDDEILAEFGQGEWRRFHVHRPAEEN